MPKLIAERIIAPTLEADSSVRIRCHEASLEQLLAELAVHRLDIVLSDQPMPQGFGLRAFNHRLGESGWPFSHRSALRGGTRSFSRRVLTEHTMLLPSQHSALRRRLDAWFDGQGIAPQVIG